MFTLLVLLLSCKSFKVITPVIIFLAVYFACSEFFSHPCPVVKVNVKAMGISGRVSHNDRSAFIHSYRDPECVFKRKERLHNTIDIVYIRNSKRIRRDSEDLSKFFYKISLWRSGTGFILSDPYIRSCSAETNKLSEILLRHSFTNPEKANTLTNSHYDTS